MDVKVTWEEGLAFMGEADSGHSVRLDGEPAAGGKGEGLRPMQLIALGLAGCTAMDVIAILQKKRQQVSAFEVRVHLERASEHPRVFTHAVIEYLITGHQVDEAAVIRAIELSATRYCSAQAMLVKAFPIELKYHIYEDQGKAAPRLINCGDYLAAPA
jgi:putative redox protein